MKLFYVMLAMILFSCGKKYEITSFTKPTSSSIPPPVIFGLSNSLSNANTIDGIDYNPIGGEFALTFFTNSSGQYVLPGSGIYINGWGNSLTGVDNSMTLNIIELGATGKFIKGTATGKLTSRFSGGPQYDFSAEFKVRNGD
jgi:hypothetical protein